MRWNDYVESEIEPPKHYEDSVNYNPATVAAFCDWLALREKIELLAADIDQIEFAPDVGAAAYAAVSGLWYFSNIAADGDDSIEMRLDAAYEVFLTETFIERISRKHGRYDADTNRKRNRGRNVPTQAIARAFVCGHGGYNSDGAPVTVPPGMTLHFLSDFDEMLFQSHSFAVLADGPDALSKQQYQAGDTVPNYSFSPENSQVEEALAVQANQHDMPLYFIGDSQWDLCKDGETALCTDPQICNNNEDNTHSCKGVLKSLGAVQNLYFMTCRSRDGAFLSTSTFTLPGESLPFHALGVFADSVETFFSDDSALTGRLRNLEKKNPARMAEILSDEKALKKMTVQSALCLLGEDGIFAYYGMYLNSPERDRAWYDSDNKLKNARKSASSFVAKFTEARSVERMSMLDTLMRRTTPDKQKKVTDFLGYRIPGFQAWLNNHEVYEEILEGARGPIMGGGDFTAYFDKNAVLLSGADSPQRYAHLLQRFAKGLKFDVTLKPATETTRPYEVEAYAGAQPVPPVVQRCLEELILAVHGHKIAVKFVL
ncbi:putative adhesin [Streptomyces vinaceus]|uniref:putative adhesin n=1 Tax=Streptomyces vinaceus TaxID=1960 RepID=UPI0035D7CDE5